MTRLVARITFAVPLRQSHAARAKVSAAVADYLGDVPGVVVVDELPEEKRLRLTVALDPPQRPGEAEALAEGCPHYVAGTFTWASG